MSTGAEAPATSARATDPGREPREPHGRADASAQQPLSAHLREARTRLLSGAVALLVGMVAGYLLSEPALDVLRAPVERLAQTVDASLNYDSITGAFDLRLTLALRIGLVLASPVLLYELLAYVLPGLTRRERRYTLAFLTAGTILFGTGCAVGLKVFPQTVELLAGFASEQDTTILQASQYVDFVVQVVLAAGVAFVLPVALVLANVLGLLPGRTILHGWRPAVIAIVLFSALATPSSDLVSMFVIAVPMTSLFFAAALVAMAVDRSRARSALIAPPGESPTEVIACSA